MQEVQQDGVVRMSAALFAAALTLLAPFQVHAAATSSPIIGEIERITIDPPGDHFAGGTMVVGGQVVILPRNLLIDLPANRLTLKQLFLEAPFGCAGSTGLAKSDACRCAASGAIATVKANRVASGDVIAGEVFVAKGVEAVNGVVTFIDHDSGYFRIGGIPDSATTGLMVRINDPSGTHTLQRGPGCLEGSIDNCSPDRRFGVDFSNYTAAFITGYPVCIPSTVIGGDRVVPASVTGLGDPFCPDSNRASLPVPNSVFFAPLKVGDHLLAEGNMEVINGVRFLSAWHLQVHAALTTRNDPTQPDYLAIEESGWDVAGFQNQRARFLLIGFTTLFDSQLDVFSVHYDPNGGDHLVPLASTVGSPNFVNQGVLPTAGGIFKIRYDVDFILGTPTKLSPCATLRSAGLPGCPTAFTIADEFRVLSPVGRELVAVTRRPTPLTPGVTARDLLGRSAAHGQYLTPVSINFPEFREINLANIPSPFIFSGEPWNLDRRLGPGGCNGACESTPQPLDPFPFSDLDPRTQAAVPAAAANRILSFFPFGVADLLAWPPPLPLARGVVPTPPLGACVLATSGGTTPPPAATPTLTSVTPSQGLLGQGGVATLTGTGFIAPTACSFGPGIDVACNVLSPTSLQAIFNVQPGAAVGTRTLSVVNAGGMGTLAAAFTVASPIVLAPPAVASVTPSTVTRGTLQTVALTGTGFQAGMTCTFGAGITVTACTRLSATSGSADLAISLTAALGVREARVTNPDAQTAALAAGLTVTAGAPPPQLLAVAPASGNPGTAVTATLTGQNFVLGASCNFGVGVTVVSCTVLSPTSATASLQLFALAAAGPRDVVVTNPDAQSSTLTAGFTISAVAPPPTGILFTDAFSGGPALAPQWSTTGTWTVGGGVLRSAVTRVPALVTLTTPDACTASASVSVGAGASASGVAVRGSAGSWYAVRLRQTSGLVELVRVTPAATSVLDSVSRPVPLGQAFTLQLRVRGTNPVILEGSVNGIRLLGASDTSGARLQTGSTGVVSGGGGTTTFDNFELSAP